MNNIPADAELIVSHLEIIANAKRFCEEKREKTVMVILQNNKYVNLKYQPGLINSPEEELLDSFWSYAEKPHVNPDICQHDWTKVNEIH